MSLNVIRVSTRFEVGVCPYHSRRHFKSYIFEIFVDKHGQVAGDSMTHSRQSSGGIQLLMKALYYSHFSGKDYNIILKDDVFLSVIQLACILILKEKSECSQQESNL